MANPSVPQVFDRDMRRLGYLENAMSVGYELPLNELWTASFSLPAGDPKNTYCKSLNYVEIYDGDNRVDLFRVIGEDFERSDSAMRVYTCEHVLATLLNDVLFQYHQIGGSNVQTAAVLNYILGKQTTRRWKLAQCDFNRQFEYNFENENLLSALFAVPNCFDSEYVWRWDTSVYPWQLSLVKPDEALRSEIRYGKNMQGVRRAKDDTGVVNRIYPLGYGEGVNQLTIRAVNNNIPYIEDAASIREYGLCPTILVDARFEHAANLKSYAQQILAAAREPYVSYEVTAIDLFRLSGDKFSRFRPGDIVRVIDTEDNITLRTRIVSVGKSDLRGSPGEITVTLANKDRDIAGSISDLQNRARINETYAQGATNLMVQNFADNADPTHPARFRVLLPAETARINKMLLNIEFEPFRGYTRAILGGGKVSKTTSNGGAYGDTTADGGAWGDTTADGGSWGSTTRSGGESSETSASGGGTTRDTGASGIDVQYGWRDTTVTDGHSHQVNVVTSHRHEVTIPDHRHDFDIPKHQHDFEVPNHSHGFEVPDHCHSFDIPDHNHSIEIPDHVHDQEFGIYEGLTARSATIRVDGNTLPAQSDYDNIDIVPYLAKDGGGRIQRGSWHTIEILPNSMSRIVAALFTQLFTQSRGGGDY